MHSRLQTLPFKVGVLMLLLVAVHGAVQYYVHARILYPSFVQLESDEARRNTDRAINALRRDLELLGPSVADWAVWDSAYDYMGTGDPTFETETFNLGAVQPLRVNYLALLREDGRVVREFALDLVTGEALSAAALGLDRIGGAYRESLLRKPYRGARLGLARGPRGPLLVAAHPVVRSDGTGPARGVAVMARLLDTAAVAEIAARAQVDLVFEPAADARADAPPIIAGIARAPFVHRTGTARVASSSLLFDLAGQPAYRLVVRTPRSITAQGRNSLQYAQFSLAAAGCVTLLAVLVALRRLVFVPIAHLTRHAMEIGQSDNLARRIALPRADEIGLLAGEFDRMVERLAESRSRLLEQSYLSGVAEMASGVLHNIGNAVTPLGVKLSTLRQRLGEAPTAEVAQAAAELADPATPHARRADLEAFMPLAAAELGTCVTHTERTLANAHAHVDQIQLILAEQQRFARAERVLEPLRLDRLVAGCLEVLPAFGPPGIRIDLDPSLATAPSVQASRGALTQVLGNLLLNAVESITAGARGGHIRIAVRPHPAQTHLELVVADDGVGIDPALLPRLFEAGVSTKSRGSGLGLHWCANTLAAMGGALRAESDGPGLGARFRLTLPLASPAQPTEIAA